MGELETELNLINQAQKGDTTALSELYQSHYPFLLRYLMKITLNMQMAEDLAQDTMLRSMEKIHLFNGKSKFSTWLITIASRIHIDQIRRTQTEKRILEQEAALHKLRWQSNIEMQEWPELLERLGKLQDDVRMTIILKHYYGYSLEEIANMLDIPIGTVKSRIHHGMNRLRKEGE